MSNYETLVEYIARMVNAIDDATAYKVQELHPVWSATTATGEKATYIKDQRVRYSGKFYKCNQDHTVDNESWTPSATPALWSEISTEEWGAWIQPTGAHNAYMLNDKCTHNGKKWISDYDNNVWEPGVFGWHEYTEE